MGALKAGFAAAARGPATATGRDRCGVRHPPLFLVSVSEVRVLGTAQGPQGGLDGVMWKHLLTDEPGTWEALTGILEREGRVRNAAWGAADPPPAARLWPLNGPPP